MKNKKKTLAAVLGMGILAILCGCGEGIGSEEEETREPIVNFRAITLGNMPEGGMDEIYRQLDELTIPELNCTLRFEFIPWGNERSQLNLVTASGEYDFIPGGVFSDYRTLVYKNAFLDLNAYLDAVPALTEHYAFYDQDTLKKCEINGGLYGLPQFGQGGSRIWERDFSTGKTCVRSGGWRKSMIWRPWKPICTGQNRRSSTGTAHWSQITGCGAACGFWLPRGNIWK